MRIRVYTDGACSGNPGPGGWAAIFTVSDGYTHIEGYDVDTTNNRMELEAVIRSLRCLLYGTVQFEYDTEEVDAIDVHSDSAYVVNAINNNWLASWAQARWKTKKGDPVKNQDLWIELLGMLKEARLRHIDVKFVKVKGHAGNTLNEMVDKLAVGESMRAQYLAGQQTNNRR